jgi:uncharacterized protein (DUF1800 family)
MTPKPRRGEPIDPWAPYAPNSSRPWNLRRVAHLHRRAGFATTWEELKRDLKDGPAASVDRLLRGESRVEGVPDDFESAAKLLADAAVASNDPERLKAWWVYRIMASPDPLTERLSLFWHDHFATSNLKVNDLRAMRVQNEMFRRLALAPFSDLLAAAVRDPALLVWLDAPANRRGHPNENLARELMELFTLGIGRYTESDVKESARALTGWTVKNGAFVEDPAPHDDGAKCLFGRTGRWKGDDLIKMLVEHPATADRLASRICGMFFGDGIVEPALVTALANDLRQHQLDIGRAVGKVLRSDAFFRDSNLGTRVLGPAEFTFGMVRALELFDPWPSTVVLADWIARLGQDLFYPPNVGGWPGGRSWLTTRAVIGRANFAAALVGGNAVGRSTPLDPTALCERHGRRRDPESVLDFASQLLLGRDLSPALRGRVLYAIGSSSTPAVEVARRAVALVAASPEGQLG